MSTWAGEDSRAKGEGWLHTSQWLKKEILVYNLFQFSFLLFGGGHLCNRKGDLYLKKIRPPKAAALACEDGRAKGGGWLHSITFFSLVLYCLAEDACAIGRGTYIKKNVMSESAAWVGAMEDGGIFAFPWEGLGSI